MLVIDLNHYMGADRKLLLTWAVSHLQEPNADTCLLAYSRSDCMTTTLHLMKAEKAETGSVTGCV